MDYRNEYSGMEVFAIKTTMPFERGLEGLGVFGSLNYILCELFPSYFRCTRKLARSTQNTVSAPHPQVMGLSR
jgi:hypothetical protein